MYQDEYDDGDETRELRLDGARLRRTNRRIVNEMARKRTFLLFWGPTAQHIATVQASSPSEAKRKAPLPYRRFVGEIYATDAMHMLWKPRTFTE
jgi:hypothetical protein